MYTLQEYCEQYKKYNDLTEVPTYRLEAKKWPIFEIKLDRNKKKILLSKWNDIKFIIKKCDSITRQNGYARGISKDLITNINFKDNILIIEGQPICVGYLLYQLLH